MNLFDILLFTLNLYEILVPPLWIRTTINDVMWHCRELFYGSILIDSDNKEMAEIMMDSAVKECMLKSENREFILKQIIFIPRVHWITRLYITWWGIC